MDKTTALADQVTWFGASRRLIAGQPDSRYGWLDGPQGPCIVKALDDGLTAYAGTLLQHERAVLARLAQLGAPAPASIDLDRPDWLVTRFAGLSLQRLEETAGRQDAPGLSFSERLAAWIHLLRRLQTMADQGVLAIDLYAANVLLPLTQCIEGQLRLNEACLVDHAHTIVAGMAIRRPIWISASMRRIAPELREAIRQDQQALIERFRAEGADLPGYSRMPMEKDQFNRRMWAEYDAPQKLQMLLDDGELRPARAMQFAAGWELERLLSVAPNPARTALAPAVRRMMATQPSARFESFTDAADALAACVAAVPLASRHRHGPLQPQDLGSCDAESDPTATPTGAASGLFTAFSAVGTRMADSAMPTRMTEVAAAGRSGLAPWLRGRGWMFAGLALGAAIGALLPW
jgi:hypothetical protein